MRIGSRGKTWWQKRSTKYAAAGTLLLALAGAALALSVGSGARAADITLGENTYNFETDSDGALLIEDNEDLEALRNAGAGTANHVFRLANDLEVSFTGVNVASGTFEGEFDGDGHVITITDINLTSAGSEGDSVSEGILFGTIAEGASVHDLIIDVTDADASYTRTSAIGHGSEETSTEQPGTSEDPTVGSGKFSAYSSDQESSNLAQEFNSDTSYYYVTDSGEFTEAQPTTGSYTTYKRETKSQEMTRTTVYDLGEPQDDAFGILCGTLSSSASVSRVEVTGNDLTVRQNASPVHYETIENGSREEYFYYKVSNEDVEGEESNINAGNITNSITVYSSGNTSESNDTDPNLTVSVSSPNYVRQGKNIEYVVEVTNKTSKTISGIALAVSDGQSSGSWSCTTGLNEGNFTLSGNEYAVFTYTITASQASTVSESFTVTYTPNPNDYSASVSATGVKNVTETGRSGNNGLTIRVTAPAAVQSGNSLIYEVTLTADNDISGISLDTDGDGSWYEDEECSQLFTNTNNITIKNGDSLTRYYCVDRVVGTPVTRTFTASYTETASGGTDTSVTVRAVVVTDVVNSLSTSGEDKEDNVTLSVSMDSATENDVTYQVTVENNSQSAVENLKFNNISNATWKTEDDATVNWNQGITLFGNNSITYYCTVSDISDSTTINTSFSLSFQRANSEQIISVESSDVTVLSTASVVVSTGENNNLSWELRPNYSSYIEGEQIKYILSLKNTYIGTDDTTRNINISSITGTIGGSSLTWYIDGEENISEVYVLKPGETLTLEAVSTAVAPASGTTVNTNVSIVANAQDIYHNVSVYEYVPYVEMNISGDDNYQYGSAEYGNSSNYTDKTQNSGNNLYTGVIAGTSSGSITEVKQNLSLNGTVDTAAENGALLAVGGIMGQGQSGSKVSGLYIIKSPSATGSGIYTGSSGTVVALLGDNANITLENSLILAEGASGVTSENQVFYNINSGYQLTNTDGANWKSFTHYTNSGSEETVLDLSWLVISDAEFNQDEDVTVGQDGNGSFTVSVAVPKTNQNLTYYVAYEARKSMSELADPTLYVAANDPAGSEVEVELGRSGYYTLLNLYSTDGFYHYIQDIPEEGQATVFPYNTDDSAQNPYEADNIGWNVVRMDDGSDVIELTFKTVVEGSIYYLNTDGIPTDGSDREEITGQTVQLPFDTETVQYWLTPMIQGYIYPTISSPAYNADSREPLLKPDVTISGGYQEDGSREDYQSLQDGNVYESGSDLRANISGMEGYTLRYLFSTSEPVASEWDMTDESHRGKYSGRYTGGDISGLMEGSSEYAGSMTLPDYAETTTVYLYLQVSKENYNDAVYCYGPIQVGPRTQISAQALIPETGTVLGEGATVVPGDVLSLGSNRDGVTLQYEIRSSESESHTWSDYNEADKPQLAASGSTVYVYTRARYSDSSYSAVAEYTFTAGDSCDGIRISPNTGSSTEEGTPPDAGGAYSIDAGEVVNLSSQTSGARIIYLASGGSYAPFTIERVTDASLVSGMADGDVSSGYTYFQNGSRWYRVSSDEVTVYDEADGAVIRNEESDAQLVYVYAVNLMKDMEPGAVTTYVYNVNPQQQVSAPEAALSTYYLPGGEDLERTEIDMGASLSFSSATQGAELYYSIGNSTGVPDTPYDPSTGIIVEGSYSETFTVRVMAVRDGMLDSEIRTFIYNIADKDAADAPTSVPTTSSASPAQVVPGEKILLSTLTRGASIYYTTDGTSPQLEELEDGSFQIAEGSSTMLYDATQGIVMPEGSSGYFTITAVAARTGLALSSEVHLTFAYPGDVMAPYASVSSGRVSASTSVVLRNRTEDAVIYYTVAYGGEEPADPTVSSPVFDESQPFVITQTTTIKAIAVKDGVASEVAEFTYTLMDTLGAPTASIESGTVVSRGTVLHLSAASGATIYYTMDGSDPTDLSNTAVVQGDSLTLNGAAGEQITIMAVARQEGKSDSEVATFTYQFSANTGGVTADVPTGSSVSNGSKVNLMTDVTGATIYYTTDGSSPDDSGIEGSTVTIQGTPGSTFTIKAVARVDGVSGTVVSFMYRIKEVPNAPTASPSGGTLTIATRVILSSNGDQIYYTTDGTTPTESSSLYTEPILIDRTTNLRAIAVSADGEVSEVSSFQYTAASKAAAPTASREDGAVLDPGTVVSLYTDTADAVIYYSTDGTEPTLDNMESLLEYTEEGIAVNRTVTVKAVAYREDLQLSDVSEFYYEVDTIPAVEMKQAEAERLAEEGLHDTDASGLARRVNASDTAGMRQLEEEEYYTVASFARDAAPDNVRLVTEVMDYSNAELDNVKLLYGDDYTILASYDIRLMSGSTAVRPDGDTEIGIPIPEGYENAAVIIAGIDGNNAVTPLETRREDGMVYAYMTDQNHYVLIGLEHPDGAGSGFNYLLILEVAAGVTAAAGIAYYISRKVKKYRKNR